VFNFIVFHGNFIAGKLFIPDSQNLLDLVSTQSRLDKTDAFFQQPKSKISVMKSVLNKK